MGFTWKKLLKFIRIGRDRLKRIKEENDFLFFQFPRKLLQKSRNSICWCHIYIPHPADPVLC